MPNTASAIVTTTVMIGRRIAKSEMNIEARGARVRGARVRLAMRAAPSRV
jgi:hypothetical protein